jgi:hypothetical protein
VIVNFWLLSIAVLLLWLPRQWLRFGGEFIPLPKSSRRRKRDNSNPRNPGDVSLRFKEEFKKPRNWIDLMRAAAGAVAIEHGCFEKAVGAPKETATQIFVCATAIYVVAVLIQTIRMEGRLTLAAPVFFVLGLSFGIIGGMAALFACIMVWVINLVLPGSSMFLVAFAGLQVCFALLLARLPVRDAALAGGLAVLPVVFSLVTKRRLVQLSKKSKAPRSS